MTSHATLTGLLNKKLKVVYKEFDAVQIGKGILVELDQDFMKLKGNRTIQLIPIERLIKVSCLNHDYEEDHDVRAKR